MKRKERRWVTILFTLWRHFKLIRDTHEDAWASKGNRNFLLWPRLLILHRFDLLVLQPEKVTSLLITNFSVNSKFVLMLRFFHQEKMTISVILREKKARRMEVYGGLKLKTSQIKEGKHERFLSHSLFLSVRVAAEHEADSRLDPVSCVGPHVCCVWWLLSVLRLPLHTGRRCEGSLW